MASGSELNLCCPICHEVYRDPVLLGCSHSFCKGCVRRWWRRKQTLQCPVCKSTSGRKHPPCNLALKNLCEAFLLERDQRASEALCGLHSEKLKLFCLDHQEPACLVCRDSEKHVDHLFRPIDEAARGRRDQLQESLKPLQEKLKVLQKVQGSYAQTAEHIKVQARHGKQQIRERFKRLRKFLDEEEEARTAALREEEEKKSGMMKEKMKALGREMAALSDAIRATEDELRAEDVSFLQNYEAAAERVRRCPLLDDPQLLSGALMDEAKHLGNLTFDVWSKMNEAAVDSYTPVVLDPNTAHPGLALSEDLTAVTSGERPKLPDNPERFDGLGIVLGSEGFASGLHSWEVEVGDSPHWVLGVAAESVDRKGRFNSQPGLWTLAFHKGSYKASSPLKPVLVLPVKKQIQRVRVHLDCDRGALRFSDPDSLIHSFSCSSTETLFPFIGTTEDQVLRIQPDTILLLNNSSYKDYGGDSDHHDLECDEKGSDIFYGLG